MSNRIVRTSVILVALVIVAAIAALFASVTFFPFTNPFEPRGPPPFGIPLDIELFYTLNAIISTVNVTLSLFLLATYVSVYRKTRSEFTIMLIIFSAVFLLNAFASNPFVIRVFGYVLVGLGPFVLLPQIFTLAALAVLLYLSLRY